MKPALWYSARAEALDRPDREQAAAQPEAEEGNSRIAQRVRVEREAVLRRGLPERERPVPFQQRPHVRLTRVIHGNQAASHHVANVNELYFSGVKSPART